MLDNTCNRVNGVCVIFSALVWGTSVKHCPQNVGKEHSLNDEDVVQILKKSVFHVLAQLIGLLCSICLPICLLS